MIPNWYVVTGGPSSGKTTLLEDLAQTGVQIFPEVARVIIDEGLAQGKTIEEIRRDERAFQERALARKQELEAGHDLALLTFFDRGMQDTLAYYKMYGWQPASNDLKAMEEAKYKTMFLLEVLPDFEQDYARTEDSDFAQKITNELRNAYEKYQIPVISVPVLPIIERRQFILDYITEHNGGSL